MPWKNGQGSTVQLAIHPPGSSLEKMDFDWRISMATISASGAFSKFGGYDRALVQIAGGRLELGHGESTRTRFLQPMKTHYFKGERALQCVVEGPAVIDVNVMVNRRWGDLKMTPANFENQSVPFVFGETGFVHIFCVEGPIEIIFGGQNVLIQRQEMLSFENTAASSSSTIQISGAKSSRAIVIELSSTVRRDAE